MIEELVKQGTLQLMSRVEDLIRTAVTNKIGPGWTIADLAGRCHKEVFSDRQVFFFDLEPILELHPPSSYCDGGTIRFHQNYRLL